MSIKVDLKNTAHTSVNIKKIAGYGFALTAISAIAYIAYYAYKPQVDTQIKLCKTRFSEWGKASSSAPPCKTVTDKPEYSNTDVLQEINQYIKENENTPSETICDKLTTWLEDECCDMPTNEDANTVNSTTANLYNFLIKKLTFDQMKPLMLKAQTSSNKICGNAVKKAHNYAQTLSSNGRSFNVKSLF